LYQQQNPESVKVSEVGNFSNNMVIEKHKDKNIFVPPSSKDHIPISYNGIFWELRIKEQDLIDFSYKFCEPDTEVFDRLKSIPINPIGLDNED
jgi:hypothetical protein